MVVEVTMPNKFHQEGQFVVTLSFLNPKFFPSLGVTISSKPQQYAQMNSITMSNIQYVYFTGKDVNVLESRRFIHSFIYQFCNKKKVSYIICYISFFYWSSILFFTKTAEICNECIMSLCDFEYNWDQYST